LNPQAGENKQEEYDIERTNKEGGSLDSFVIITF